MNNAQQVIKTFGGSTRLSKLTGIPRSTIDTWKLPKPKGSGGIIPHKHQRKIAKLAFDHGLNINHLIISEEQ